MALEVSVIIPTYNRKERLLGCLDTLAAQTLARDRFEVVVASDGSTDGTAAAAAAAAARLGLALRVVEASHGGPGHARNAGVRAATAAVLAFLDDDVRAATGWLAAGLARFADSGVAAVEGRTLPVATAACFFTTNLANLEGGLYPTCNIFYRKAVLDQLGGFDERFRRTREDADLAYRVLDAGHRIVFEPAATVEHVVDHRSVLQPVHLAAQLPDSVLLWAKHPGRDTARPGFYRSDVVKMGLFAAALVLVVVGFRLAALSAGLLWLALVLRTLLGEVRLARALRPDRLLGLVVGYGIAPFANLWYYIEGRRRVRRLGMGGAGAER